ncbi:acyl-CoA dehydrogenase family protein [Amycolatopsis suaedae]|uniref:Acyl-CoA dehydrogenase n=1 Tax=Amycolatopsis suaedae TaxID=2510978 RepID=A0A4Q7J3A9_9PSEU|nr:acyl-CoA dehydrogenase family protein [Amycolatopsis suaedae]RZQ61102.1 acyl-CoA dehydrogenase [Amycolatopsis suaedae]
MRLGDNEDQARFRAGLRRWLAERVPAPGEGAPRTWTAGELRSWTKTLYDAGYAGLTWPAEHGGQGLSPAYQAIYAEESALAEAPDHAGVIGLNMVGPAIVAYGTTGQKAAHLPRILSGDSVFCQGFSEPGAGSDLASVRTRARRDGEDWVLDGEKVWSSYAHLADHCLLLARTDPAAAKHRGLTCFLLDLRQAGVEVRPLRQLSGDTDFNQIVLTGARVPGTAVLGEPGQGWRVALTTLAHERGTFGITLTARLAVQLDRLVATARATGADTDPVVRAAIAELHVTLQGLRYTGYRALAAAARTGEPGPESSILKLRWSAANQRVATLALRLLGDRATADGPDAFWGGYWQHQRLRSRANSIEGGTSEILRGIVAERVLGLPRAR